MLLVVDEDDLGRELGTNLLEQDLLRARRVKLNLLDARPDGAPAALEGLKVVSSIVGLGLDVL